MSLRITLIALFTLLLFSTLSAQSKLDSFINVINQWEEEKQDSNLYNTYYDLIKMTYGKDMDTCQHFLHQSLAIAKKIEFKPGLQKSSYLLAVINSKKGDYENSLELLDICIQAYPHSLKRHMRCLKMKGDINRKSVNYDEAKKYYDEAEEYGVKAKDTLFLGTLYNSRAILYEDLSQLDKSVENYLKSAEIDKDRGDLNGYFFSIINIASQYEANIDFEKAEYYVNSLKTELDTLTDLQRASILQHEGVFCQEKGDDDQAIVKFKESIDLAQKINFKPLMAIGYLNAGQIFFKKSQFESAYNYFISGLDYVQEEQRLFNYYIWLADSKIMFGDCVGAKKWADKADSKVSTIRNYLFLRRYYAVISKYYACIDKPDLSALAIQNTLTYSDSFYFERREVEANKIEATFQNKIKTDSINFLSLQNEKHILEISRRNIGLGTTCIILLLLGMLARYYLKLSEKRKELNMFLESQNENLIFQNNELQKLNGQLEQKAQTLANKPIPKTEVKELSIHSNDKTFFVPFDKIKYAQAEDDGTRVFFDDISKWTKSSLKKFEKELEDESFVRISRRVVVNVKHIAWINTNTLKMKAGAELKIGRTYKELIKSAIES